MTQKQLYDRKSLEDARIVFEELVPDLHTRTKLAEFMLDAVQYAERQKPGNWNVNLDPYGKFIKMNVGFLYCILIRKVETLIICNRNTLQLARNTDIDKITYLGYKKKRQYHQKTYMKSLIVWCALRAVLDALSILQSLPHILSFSRRAILIL